MPHPHVPISVVIPVRDSAAHLTRCLAALAASIVGPLDVIVVDDGSTDGSSDVAQNGGALVVCVPDGPRGPAAARNLGARHAKGEILFFLDADVLVHSDTIANMERCLRDHPDVAAAFGSYDDAPDHPSMVSRYRNLLHHYVHQHGNQEASTFWAGSGAVRRSVFEAVGGFDERYARPSIEDIELGVRLRAAGHRIVLRPEIQVTHLKRWTFAGTVRSDIRDRAIPWTRLIFGQARIPADLNTSLASRLAAVAAWLVVGSLALWTLMPGAGWGALGALLALMGLNAGLYGFFLRKGGLVFAVVAVAMHGLYLLYSSAAFAGLFIVHWVHWGHRLAGRRAA